MDVDQLASEIYEDLNPLVHSVVQVGTHTDVLVECDYWVDRSRRVRFRLSCSGTAESVLSPGESCFSLVTDHPLLLKHNAPHGNLFLASAPANTYEVLGILVHENDRFLQGWRPLSDSVNEHVLRDPVTFFSPGNGLLARGPLCLLERFASALSDKVRTSLVHTHTPAGGLRALVFDVGYLVCRTVTAREEAA